MKKRDIVGWAVSAAILAAVLMGFTTHSAVPNCEGTYSTGSCSGGCTPSPVGPPSVVCNDLQGGCCKGFCQLYLCEPISTCSPVGYRTWTNDPGAIWDIGNCPVNWETWSECGYENSYCP